MPKLYMHVGLHKTGTSAIQAFAEKNRDKLRDQGLLYASYEPYRGPAKGHHNFAHAVAGLDSYLSLEDASVLAEKWAREAAESGAKVLVSAESIYRHLASNGSGQHMLAALRERVFNRLLEATKRTNDELDFLAKAILPDWLKQRRAYLKRLAGVLHKFDTTVLFVLRRQDDFARSYYQEVTKKNSTGSSFADHREWMCLHRLRYYDNILLFKEFFSEVKVLTYEDLNANRRLPHDFFTALGIDTGGMEDVGIVRESFSYRDTLAKAFIGPLVIPPRALSPLYGVEPEKADSLDRKFTPNRRKQRLMANEKIVEWIQTPQVQQILDKHLDGKRVGPWESNEIRRQFLERFAAENEAIRAKYFPEKQRLFPPIPDDEVAPELSALPQALKADLLAAAKAAGLVDDKMSGTSPVA